MGFVNLSPSLQQMWQSLSDRVLKLETATRFTAPNVTSDPTNPRRGDIWLNTTTNQLKVVDANGTVRVITWT
jgi:hypothetical protein